MEARNQRGSRGDHDAAEDQGTDDSPFKDTMLDFLVNLESAKNHEEHKKVVDAQRFLDHIAGEKLDAADFAVPVPHKDAKGDRQGDPDDAPQRSFPDSDFVSVAMENSQVHRDGQ